MDDTLFDRLLPPPEEVTIAGAVEHKRLLQRLERGVGHFSPKLRV